MAESEQSRILVVDDEEAILETMTFTFEDDYRVFTASDASRGLEILAEESPIAAVITDQRMPTMTGVEFLAEVYKRFPHTTRIILTGFADMEAIIQSINDGHVYAYITKPWEPAELKQLVRRAVQFHQLSRENDLLLGQLRRSNTLLSTLMDELETGAIALNPGGKLEAINRAACQYLGVDLGKVEGGFDGLLAGDRFAELRGVVMQMESEQATGSTDVVIPLASGERRLRVSVRDLAEAGTSETLGKVILLREVSHEPVRREFEALVSQLASCEENVRDQFASALQELDMLRNRIHGSQHISPRMKELEEQVSRTQTALQNWLHVDNVIVSEDYPDAQLLVDRMRVAEARWPLPENLPKAVQLLAERVENYYESGENAKEPSL